MLPRDLVTPVLCSSLGTQLALQKPPFGAGARLFLSDTRVSLMVLIEMLVWQKPSGPDRPSTPIFHPWPAYICVSGRSVLPVSQPVCSHLRALPEWSAYDSDGWLGRNGTHVHIGLWCPLAARRSSHVGTCNVTQGENKL